MQIDEPHPYYSSYLRGKPSERNSRRIFRWHEKLLCQLILDRWQEPPLSVLEVGPGHGYFAEACRTRGIPYSFEDTSSAVTESMTARGFEGRCVSLDQPEDAASRSFDIIWVSHVLEHSTSWTEARQMVSTLSRRLKDSGELIIVGPDYLDWKHHFWNIDFSHGFPTTLRNVAQLLDDVGLTVVLARHHRGGGFSLLTRAFFALLASMPHHAIDRVITPQRSKLGDGLTISWKAVFGWRQIAVIARRVKNH